ncbi:small ribosomal subunit protein mS80 (rPPR6)-like [Rutidosis leptorrhynchoides]|uniref:small ribosomal subunit protein mS80 (rPPR6)-like n=1 Tax=Rutidosis leptorrhynchoides TaxID=125765 RepID=UPI003A9996AF
MWRSRLIASHRFRSAHNNAIRGFNSKVHSIQTFRSCGYSNDLNSVALFSKSNSIRFFSSNSLDSANEANEEGEFSIDEMWKDGVNEASSVLEMDVSESETPVESVVNDEVHEVDVNELDRVVSLLKSKDDEFDVDGVKRSIESSLDDMNLDLSEEFVMGVLESENVSGENLIVFFKWAAEGKNQEAFSVATRSLDALVSAVCKEYKMKVAYSLWDLVKEIGEKENGVVTTEMLNSLISLFSRLGEGMAGYEVFNKFDVLLCVTNADSYYFTVEALCRRSIFDQVGLVIEKMISEGKLPEAGKTGNIICYLCKGGLVKEAHSVYLWAKGKESYPPQRSVNSLISSLCDRKKNDADSVHLALKMLDDYSGEEKRKYAIKQFSCVINGLCRINDIDGAKSLLSKMIKAGPPPGNAVFNTIINALSKSGDMAEAINIMRLMEGRGLKPDVFAYSVIMSGYTKGGEMDQAAKMLAEAKKKHCKLTPVTYHTMISGYCKLEQYEKAVKLLHEMEEFGVQPNADEYSKLIQSVCLKAADWGMAEKLLDEMMKKGLHLNGITKSLVRAVKELEKEASETKNVSVEA